VENNKKLDTLAGFLRDIAEIEIPGTGEQGMTDKIGQTVHCTH
jgi:hypothetical protein